MLAQGSVILYLEATQEISLPETNLNTYIQPQPYWEVNSLEVKNLLKELQTAEEIYNYLVENFDYDFSRLSQDNQRYGAQYALSHPEKAICQEFTDAFIALARAAKIPARELNGFAYTQNSQLRPLSLVKDVLHAWPEYYDTDKRQWVPVDPTWGNTTGGVNYFDVLDLNHFVFSIRGSSSQKPYPAGYYKLADTATKDISIEFTKEIPTPQTEFEIDMKVSPLSLLGLRSNAELIIHNNSNQAFYNLKLLVDSQKYQISNQETSIPAIIPLSTQKVTIGVKTSLFNFTSENLKISINNQIYEKQFNNFQEVPSIISFSFFALGVTAFIITIVSWRLLVFIRKK